MTIASAFAMMLSTSAVAQSTVCVSVDSSGVPGNGYSSRSRLSADGEHVAFLSMSTNLVPMTSPPYYLQVYTHDVSTGATECASIGLGGAPANDVCCELFYIIDTGPAISADGHFVAFESLADNLVPGTSGESPRLYLRDMIAGSTQLITSNGYCPALSDDGRFLAYVNSEALVLDRQTGITQDLGSASLLYGPNYSPSISITPDGRFVTFPSGSSSLVHGDTNGVDDVFVKDRAFDTMQRINTNSLGYQANDTSAGGTISKDGRFVFFTSFATNLGGHGQRGQCFRKDRHSGAVLQVSLFPVSDGQPDSISADGNRVALDSPAGAYVRDLPVGSTTSFGIGTTQPSLSRDGRSVSFTLGGQVYL